VSKSETGSTTLVRYRSAVPVIATDDVLAAPDYYTRVLGFEKHFVYGDPPVYAGIRRDEMLLYLTLDPEMVSALKKSGLHPDVFLWVEDVDAAYQQHQAGGARIVEEIADRPWDARQYVVEDPNGYHLKFAEPLDE
jgi:uncharacterized glyoxalase superfamily protein PhnB